MAFRGVLRSPARSSTVGGSLWLSFSEALCAAIPWSWAAYFPAVWEAGPPHCPRARRSRRFRRQSCGLCVLLGRVVAPLTFTDLDSSHSSTARRSYRTHLEEIRMYGILRSEVSFRMVLTATPMNSAACCALMRCSGSFMVFICSWLWLEASEIPQAASWLPERPGSAHPLRWQGLPLDSRKTH